MENRGRQADGSPDRLYDAILSLKSREECARFFEDLCTINEILSMAQRIEIAEMLLKGRTYLEIADLTGAATATISRVNRALRHGAGGYSLVLESSNGGSYA